MSRILLVEENLKTIAAHYYAYAMCLAKEARTRGDDFLVVANVAADQMVSSQGVYPVLTHARLSRSSRRHFSFLGKIDFITNNFYCYRDLSRFLRKIGGCDCIFFPTASHYQLFCIWALLILNPKLVRFVVVFFVDQCTKWQEGEPRPKPEKIAWILRFQLRLLAPMVRRQRALIAVETAVAQAEYEKLSGLDVQLWGHPVYLPVANTSDHQAQVVLSSLGPARHEKGSDILVQALDLCLSDSRFDHCHFIVQWMSDFMMPDGSHMVVPSSLEATPRVQLINHPVDNQLYQQLLASSSAVLLPYRQTSYYGRLSRVSIEAAVSGIPIIASPGTHAAHVIEDQGAGVVMDDYSVRALVASIALFLADESSIRQRAQQRASVARQLNSPGIFLDKMLQFS